MILEEHYEKATKEARRKSLYIGGGKVVCGWSLDR
jgi:hypothetical protein